MTWWAWTLLWVVLVAGSGWVMFRIGRSLLGKAMGLVTELGTAADRLGAVAQELETISENSARAEELAVFADPTRLRQQRILAGRGPARSARPAPGDNGRPAGSSR